MNLTKAIARMKKERYIRVWRDARDGQWIGSESAVYWCGELPRLNEKYIGVMGNIKDETIRVGYTVEVMDGIPDGIDVSEAREGDVELEPYNMVVDGLEAYHGMSGTILLDRAVLKPIEGSHMRMFERAGKGGTYIIVMVGMFVAAVLLNWQVVGEERFDAMNRIMSVEMAKKMFNDNKEQ